MAIDFPNSPSPGANHTVDGKTWTFTDGKWALNVGVGGVQGPAGVAIQGTAPTTTDVLWADTSVSGLAVIPVGGTTGQVLAKSSSASYDTAWATPVTSSDLALKAPLASPALTGTPTSTTATPGTNNTQIATTAYTDAAVAALVDSAPATLNTLDELALALGDDANFATTTATAIGLKAPSASPTFTGVPTAPTAAAGTNTTQLATTEFVTAAAAGVTSGFRNVVINGGFDVWQRGTSFSNPASGAFTADRMFPVYDGSGATRTISQGQFDPYLSGASITATPPTGTSPTYFLRWNQSVAGTGGSYNILYANRVENVRLLAGKTVTLSFYAKSGASLTMPLIDIEQSFGSGGSPSASVYSTAANAYSVTTSWQRFTYTFTIPSAAGKVIGTDANSSYTTIRFWVPLNTTFVFDIWGIQLETGSQATPFEQRPYGTELQLCQRYFWAMAVPSSVPGVMVSGYGNYCYMMLNTLNPVPMRTPPAPLTHPSYPLATYPPYIADFNSNLRTVTAVDMSSPLMVRWTYDSTKLTTGLSLGLNYGDANRTLWLYSEF
jgi:hypothetical protein